MPTSTLPRSSSNQELRQLVDTANASIFGTDMDLVINEWNLKTAEVTGYPREEALHKHLLDNFISCSSMRGDETSNFELDFETKSNGKRILLINVTARRSSVNDQEVCGILIVGQDVTDQAMEERDALARAQELRKLVDQANAPIFGINLHGAINEWNDKTANLTGYSRAEVVGKPLMTLVMPKLQGSVQDVLQKALRGEETSNYELEFRTKSNETL
eukprot:CAMPEP_0116045208 /NCGR_PEP_ID=MMETSP0321-20121206/27478_1 /TAXON_ID=163516 /ORGANISM="Leptocylindrus danicus var. danicus, Strain B650" /LENGTH=216 /DNA_ID=CAMNT_0003526491 /DNA_START=216 /DNA_END=864 /DNA_ORIENTATION=-